MLLIVTAYMLVVAIYAPITIAAFIALRKQGSSDLDHG
jgi:hypothetical protein